MTSVKTHDLLRLATMLEDNPPKRFDMTNWCDCAYGYAVASGAFPDVKPVSWLGIPGAPAVAFGLTPEQQLELFSAGSMELDAEGNTVPNAMARERRAWGPRDAAANIRRFVARCEAISDMAVLPMVEPTRTPEPVA